MFKDYMTQIIQNSKNAFEQIGHVITLSLFW